MSKENQPRSAIHFIHSVQSTIQSQQQIIWARRAHNKTVVASQGASTDSRFMEEKLWLELSDGDENWHEHWLGHGRRLEGLGFGIAHAQRAQLCAKRARMHLFAVYGG